MAEKKTEAGEYIYREGDAADVAYIVISGKVELLESSEAQQDLQTGLIEPGQAFGELAIFSTTNIRSHSARALEASILQIMTPEEFQAHLAKCPEIQPFLKRAMERMKSTRVKVKASLNQAVVENEVTKITVAPASDALKAMFQPIEIPLNRLPFRIGGYPEGGEPSRRDQLHLALASHENPLRISRQHCEITIENKALVISDLGSRFCTKVNEVVIGRGRGSYMAPLKKGVNEITLGAVDGPYKIRVTCD